MTEFQKITKKLSNNQNSWLITGVAGFIGSNLLETLLKLNQKVIGLDNFSTGYRSNLEDVSLSVSKDQWRNFEIIEGDIRDFETCLKACNGVDYVLHQAALGSVPRSIEDPISTNETNILGFLNILLASRDSSVKSFTYAASSSTYGDHQKLPKVEDTIGNPLSPYAVTKLVNELYADVFAQTYGFNTIGLRYFNIFGKRQDPAGAYAAVIPKWISAILDDEPVYVNGDGETSRDFCYIDNAVQANILAALTADRNKNNVYNVAVGDRTSLNELFEIIKSLLSKPEAKKIYRDFRLGDVKHSQADISKANLKLGYSPEYDVFEGLAESMSWYIENARQTS